MNTLYVLGQYGRLSMRAQLQYRAAFLVAAAGQFLSSGVEFCGMWALFERFGHIQGWRFAEVAFFYAVVNCTFAIADALSSGFDQFDKVYVKTGEFDRGCCCGREAQSYSSLGMNWPCDASGAWPRV